jgi:hypothetical protein
LEADLLFASSLAPCDSISNGSFVIFLKKVNRDPCGLREDPPKGEWGTHICRDKSAVFSTPLAKEALSCVS